MSTISDDKAMIERRISQKRAMMEKSSKEFNEHTAEANRLQRVVERLWTEIESDKRKLANLTDTRKLVSIKTFTVTQ